MTIQLLRSMPRRHKSSSRWKPSYFNNSKQREHRRDSRRRTKIFSLSALIIVLLLLSWVSYLLLRPAGCSTQDCYVYITDTTSCNALISSITDELKIKDPTLLRNIARLVRLEDKLRPGRYRLAPEMSILSICKVIAYGAQKPIRLSFSSVRTQPELVERLTAPLAMSAEDLTILLEDSTYCASLGFTTESIRCLFLPDTHEVYWTITPEELLNRYKHSYQKFWTVNRRTLAKKIGLTPIEVSIISSIVEEESSKTDEYGDIAGLYINRLRKGMPLQADPTLKYAAGDFFIKRIGGNLLKTNSPYNTYIYPGLPPGPIRYPQKATIDLVLNLTSHDYLYMCARTDFSGYHSFATNYMEHLENARAYRKALDERGITQ